MVNYDKNNAKIKIGDNNMNKHLDEMLQKRMDRKDFLKHVAMGVAVITGAAGIVKMVNPQEKQAAKQTQPSLGYGASVYGGRPAGAQKS